MSSESSPEATSFILKNFTEHSENKQKFIFKVHKLPEDNKRLDSENSTPYQKKLGRKQDNTKPISKRIEQNRIAQRAFRERRENYIKTLESKVKDLEEAQLKTKLENEKLLSYLQSIEQKSKLPAQNSSVPVSILASNVLPIDSPKEPLNISFDSSLSNQTNNFNLSGNYEQVNSTSFDTQNQLLTQPLYNTNITEHNSVNSTLNVSSTNTDMQKDYTSTGQQPVMNLVNDYMFPDATTISSGLSFQPAATTTGFSFTNQDAFVSSFMPQASLPYSTYFSSDYYPASTVTAPQLPEANVPSLLPSQLTSDNLTSDSSPLVDPLEIMNPNRLPPTPQELYRLAVHHKMMTEKMKNVTYTIDDLCEAMRKKATCSAVHEYLTSYLGQDPLQLV